MTIADTLISDFDHEMATTRTLLARVPEKSAAWTPHPKSMPLGDLAQHIVNLVAYAEPTFTAEQLDFADPGTAKYNAARFETTTGLVEMFDRNVAIARKAIAGASDAQMQGKWTLRVGPRVVFTRPRADVVRSFVLSHLIHHRGQLSVYLRLNDVPLPPIYGPTADESF
jgi:uncharacterized damage-inducible protein DinB